MTTPQFWLGLVLGICFVALALAVVLLHRQRADSVATERGAREPLPRTLLQNRALWGLVVGGVSSAVAVAVVLAGEPGAFLQDSLRRYSVYGVFALGLLGYAMVWMATRRAHRGEVELDERDRAILAYAPRVQTGAILLCLLGWAIALTELYWDHGEIPISFPFLIFLSSCVVGLLAFSAGILIGYRRA